MTSEGTKGMPDFTPKGGRVLASFDTPRGPAQALSWPDGAIGIRHVCKLAYDDVHIITAPLLQLSAGHVVEQVEPLTVSPSVGCFDCGLHGFIRGGSWQDAGSPTLEDPGVVN